ncbi:ASP-1 protein [Aphelenchoides avenae]|nr:ASP-1 protein [Aphelenchus avenae]
MTAGTHFHRHALVTADCVPLAQHFNVWFSTGWSEFWVTDSGCMLYRLGQAPFAPCPAEPQPGYKRAFFNESASSTLKKANRGRAELYYANGWLATDVFQLGGLKIENMSVVLADRLSDDFDPEFRALKNWPIDGILGLGPGAPWDNTGEWASPLQQIIPTLDKPMFTFALSGHQDQKAGTGAGFLTYGALDTVNCAKDWHYVDAASDDDDDDEFGTWRTFIDEFNTGSGGLQLPGGLITQIVKAARAEYDFPTDLYLCSCNVKLPDIVVTIGGRNYSMPSSEYVLDIQYKPGKCVLNLSSGDGDDDGPFSFGDPFYRAYCTSFDVGQQKIGFAKSLI